jgi:hypothetical protein
VVDRLESSALDAYALHRGWPRKEMCRALSRRVLRNLDVGELYPGGPNGELVGGATWGPERLSVVGRLALGVRAVPHEIGHALEWELERRLEYDCGPGGTWDVSGMTAAVDHAMELRHAAECETGGASRQD